MSSELENYIKQMRAQGHTDAQIRQDLLAAGWRSEQLDAALIVPDRTASNFSQKKSSTLLGVARNRPRLVVVAGVVLGLVAVAALVFVFFGSSSSDFDQMVQNTLEADVFVVTGEINVQSEFSRTKVFSEQTVDNREERKSQGNFVIEFSAPDGSEQEKSEGNLLQTDDATYIKLTEFSSIFTTDTSFPDKWVKADSSFEDEVELLAALAFKDYPEKIFENRDNYQIKEAAETEIVDGEEMTKFTLDIKESVLNELSGGSRVISENTETVDVEAWFSTKEHKLSKLYLQEKSEAEGLTVEAMTEITFKYPSEIEEISEPQDFTTVEQLQQEERDDASQGARDVKRISDLRFIQLAMETFFDENGAYLNPAQPNVCQNAQIPVAPQTRSLLDFLGSTTNDERVRSAEDPLQNNNYFYGAPLAQGNKEYVLGARLEDSGHTLLTETEELDGTVFGCNCEDPVYCVGP